MPFLHSRSSRLQRSMICLFVGPLTGRDEMQLEPVHTGRSDGQWQIWALKLNKRPFEQGLARTGSSSLTHWPFLLRTLSPGQRSGPVLGMVTQYFWVMAQVLWLAPRQLCLAGWYLTLAAPYSLLSFRTSMRPMALAAFKASASDSPEPVALMVPQKADADVGVAQHKNRPNMATKVFASM